MRRNHVLIVRLGSRRIGGVGRLFSIDAIRIGLSNRISLIESRENNPERQPILSACYMNQQALSNPLTIILRTDI